MNPLHVPGAVIDPALIMRRDCLKGVSLGAGAVLLQPFLSALAAEDRGAAPPPRIVFVIEGNGLWEHHIRPPTLGNAGMWNSPADTLVDASLAGQPLPDPIAPLEAVKDRMSIVLGLSSRQAYPNHGAGYGMLGCYNSRGGQATNATNNPFFQTVDHALAESLPGIVPVLGLGVHGNPDTTFAQTVSVVSYKRPLPIICKPDVAFGALFGSVAQGEAAKAFQARNSLLDWCASDIKRVQRHVPAAARERLDAYLASFEEIRSRQGKVAANKERIAAHIPAIDTFDSKLPTDRFEAHCVLAVAALASRLTNVAVIDANCGPATYHTWTDLGVKMNGHEIGHLAGQPSREEHAVPIRRFFAKRVADLARRMAAVKEGDGTLLDNSLIIYLSDSAEEHHAVGKQWPMVLVGNLGGRLKTAGRFLQFPGYGKPGHRTIANFFLALLHAVGDKRKIFGEPDQELRDIDTSGPLAELLS